MYYFLVAVILWLLMLKKKTVSIAWNSNPLDVVCKEETIKIGVSVMTVTISS